MCKQLLHMTFKNPPRAKSPAGFCCYKHSSTFGERERVAMGRYVLHGHYGWGSVLTEAQLDWYELPYDFVDVGDLYEDPVAQKKLIKINHAASRRYGKEFRPGART
jgi:hypothetical protein